MKEIIIVRHAQSHYNVKLTEHLDSELTQEGHKQAKETAEFLAYQFPDIKEYQGRVSPFHRTLQTANYIHEQCGVNFTVDYGIHELIVRYESFGIPHRKAQFPQYDWTFLDKFEEISFPKGTMNDFMVRMTYYYHFALPPGKYICVSHGTPSHVLAEIASGKIEAPTDPNIIHNCGISWIKNGETIWFNKVVYN